MKTWHVSDILDDDRLGIVEHDPGPGRILGRIVIRPNAAHRHEDLALAASAPALRALLAEALPYVTPTTAGGPLGVGAGDLAARIAAALGDRPESARADSRPGVGDER